MTEQEQHYITKIKGLIDQGLSMAEAFLKVFEHHEIQAHEELMGGILQLYSIQGSQIGNDHFFADGSRLSIDTYYDCMVSTKSVNYSTRAGYSSS